jgi:hypothetical protein
VSAQTPRKRKTAIPPNSRTVKASLVTSVELHARWGAAATLAGMTRTQFAVQAITVACRGIIVVDRRKQSSNDSSEDRPDQEPQIRVAG